MEETIQYFTQKGVPYKLEWLENAYKHVSTASQTLYLNYLCTDISESSIPKIRLSDFKTNKTTITERIVLQVCEVVDISQSMEERNLFHSIPYNETLKLLLSDGATYLVGISKGKITKLNVKVNPGAKIALVPPVEVRYGVLFLDDTKFEVLGGNSPKLIEKRKIITDPKEFKKFKQQKDNDNNKNESVNIDRNENNALDTINTNNNTSISNINNNAANINNNDNNTINTNNSDTNVNNNDNNTNNTNNNETIVNNNGNKINNNETNVNNNDNKINNSNNNVNNNDTNTNNNNDNNVNNKSNNSKSIIQRKDYVQEINNNYISDSDFDFPESESESDSDVQIL